MEIQGRTKLFAKLRGEKESLRTGFYTLLLAEDGVVSYMRSTEDGKDAFGKECDSEDIIIIVNAKGEGRHINLNLSHLGVTGIFDTLSGESISADHRLEMQLYPHSYRILTAERKKNKCIKIQNT